MIRHWLIESRNNSKQTQLKVAQTAKISEGFYCQLESGKRNPSVKIAKQIAKYLSFDWQKFFE